MRSLNLRLVYPDWTDVSLYYQQVLEVFMKWRGPLDVIEITGAEGNANKSLRSRRMEEMTGLLVLPLLIPGWAEDGPEVPWLDIAGAESREDGAPVPMIASVGTDLWLETTGAEPWEGRTPDA